MQLPLTFSENYTENATDTIKITPDTPALPLHLNAFRETDAYCGIS